MLRLALVSSVSIESPAISRISTAENALIRRSRAMTQRQFMHMLPQTFRVHRRLATDGYQPNVAHSLETSASGLFLNPSAFKCQLLYLWVTKKSMAGREYET